MHPRIPLLAFAVGGGLIAACVPHPAPERVRAEAAAGEMARLPAGTYRLAWYSGPAHDIATYVGVSPFLLDATEVTVADYDACVKAGRCTAAGAEVRWQGLTASERAAWSPACNQDRADRADHPVNCVDWDQARAYCAWAGKRLPTEEEWEWAARNGADGTSYPWGNDPPAGQPCWDGASSEAAPAGRTGTCPVGSHPGDATRYGVTDLSGNVWEWTSSDAVVFTDSRGRGGTPVKVARGGSWADTVPLRVSRAGRILDLPWRRDARLGFRCASAP